MADISVSATSSLPSSPEVKDNKSLLPESSSSSSSSDNTSISDGPIEETADEHPPRPCDIPELFAENIVAKVIRTASRTSSSDPTIIDPSTLTPIAFPEIVPQEGPNAGRYEFRDPEFWTCGFFPGSLYGLLERYTKHPHCSPGGERIRSRLRQLCTTWTTPLHSMATRTDTHDIGFIVMPALKRDWELTANPQSLHSIVRAAHSLASRYVASAGAIRSWDVLLKKDITVTDTADNLIVIIDSLCNLDLLFYAAAHSADSSLRRIAATHARTLLHTHLRLEQDIPVPGDAYQGPLYSTCHVANIDPRSGVLKWRCTAQGYDNDSTWARGQAWAILGYAQTYMWTKEAVFLDAACGVAEYFLHRLATAPECCCVEVKADGGKKKTGRYVPLWDFDAPVCSSSNSHEEGEEGGEEEEEVTPLRDSSAGVIAANGLLVLSQALLGVGQEALAGRFRRMGVQIVRDTVALCGTGEEARFVLGDEDDEEDSVRVEDCVAGKTFEAVLRNGTANNNRNARRRYRDHGLVYGDYYLIEFGNRMLDLGIV
ncbi:hypothetical protein FE257_009566 [Aspergillus nanangensis]|uniref:Unsaturated glucuronyl hydrolase n=1 Tax=Aspergillus nanangensis TaxID=2582783 RepID=A0AAD4CJP7_ASPNN|nr:hypothetical protein FE257_009566 [Aspergillus nanangensis]